MKILFADDDLDFLKMRGELLRAQGHEVVECSSEKTARQFIETRGEEIDIALLDLRMESDESGFHLIELLERTHPDVVSIVVTAYNTLDHAARCLNAGAFGFVFKPEITESLGSILKRGEERRRRLARERLSSLRDRLELTLADWWAREAIGVFSALASAGGASAEQSTEAITRVLRLYGSLVARQDLAPLPDESQHTVDVRQLINSLPGRWLRGPVLGRALDLRVRTSLTAIPATEQLERFLEQSGFPPTPLVQASASGAYALIQFRAVDCELDEDDLEQAHKTVAGGDLNSDRDAYLASFALYATGLGAQVEVQAEGADTLIILRMPTA